MSDFEVVKLFLNRTSNPFSVERRDDYIFVITDRFWFDDLFLKDRGFRFKFNLDEKLMDYTTITKGDE